MRTYSPDIKTFTLADITKAWDGYQSAYCWRTLKGGKWTVYTKEPGLNNAVSCQMVKVRSVMSFPRYLEVFDA